VAEMYHRSASEDMLANGAPNRPVTVATARVKRKQPAAARAPRSRPVTAPDRTGNERGYSRAVNCSGDPGCPHAVCAT
jgi:hypothetical protein